MKQSACFALLLFVFAIVGCGFPKSTSIPTTLSDDAASRASAKWPDATPNALATGQRLFVQKCNLCHGYPDVKSVTDERWPSVMQKMGKRADLTDAETADVLHFVLAARAETPP